jgi:HK97 family phage portal protein
MIQKATSATDLHVAHVGRAALTIRNMSTDLQRIPLEQLIGRFQMWAYRCSSLNAQVAASVPFKLVRVVRNQQTRRDLCRSCLPYREPSKKELAYLRGRLDVRPSASVTKLVQGATDDLVVIDRHPLIDLLHDVNPWQDGYAFREGRYTDLQLTGRAYTLVVGEEIPAELWRIMPHKCRVLKDAVDFVGGFAVGSGSDEQLYRPDEVLWYRMFDPLDPWGGIGPLEAWLRTVDSSLEVQGFQSDLMRNHGTPDGIITTEGAMSDTQKRAFRRDWRRMFGSMFRRRESIGFLSNAKYERISQTNRELEFTQSMQILRDFVGQAFGVPKPLLTADDVNRTNAREARTQHMELTIWPMVQRVEDVDNAQLAPRYGDDLAIMHENPIPEDEAIRIQERASLLSSGYSVNEVRIDEGREPLEDANADVPMLAAGLVPLGGADADEQDDSEGVTDDALLAGVDVQPQQVLAGQQITAATAIITAVINDELPLESARGQLVVMFNLTPEQADQMLAGVEAFEKPEPEIPPMLPGAAPDSSPPPSDDGTPEQRTLATPSAEVMLAVLEKATAPAPTLPAPGPVHLIPHVTVNLEQGGAVMKAPDIEVHVPPAEVRVEAPPALPPAIEVNVPPAEVRIEAAPPANVEVNVPAPAIEVNVPTPEVHVQPPSVEIAPQPIEVKAPDVNVEVMPATVKQEAPIVTIEPPVVNVNPEITVTPIVDLPPRKVTFRRDRDTGVIREADVVDS